MATLSDFKIKFIKVSKWIGIGIAVLVGLFLLAKVALFVKELISPTPPPPPTVSFGKLPKIKFPKGPKENLVYTIDTVSGGLPDFPDRTNVYKMVNPEPDILAVERASDNVANLDFRSQPEQLSDVLYRFTSPGPPPKNIILNVNIPEFVLYSSYLTDPIINSAANLPNEQGAIDVAEQFLQTLNFYPEDIDTDKTKTEFYDIKNGVLGSASSLSKAKLVSVYFFQKDKDKMPIVYPFGGISSMNLIIGGGEYNPQVVNARFFHQNISEDSATYPIRTSDEAYEELKKGNVFIASYTKGNPKVVIKKVYLAFYVEGQKQNYLMPVVVFEGTNDFIGYVSAIKDEWIGN